MDLLKIASSFDSGDTMQSLAPITGGHIHDSYRVQGRDAAYTLQRINTAVFQNPGDVMHNILLVTDHLKKVFAQSGLQRVLQPLPVRQMPGEYLLYAGSGCFRMYRFIDGAYTPGAKNTAERLEIGRAFGRFLKGVSALDPGLLKHTIPDFHNTISRYAALDAAIQADALGRAGNCRAEIDGLRALRKAASLVSEGLARGDLPVRVVHNDTKLTNVLLDQKTLKAVCVIDLDTVMPGCALHDYGDMLRYGACTAPEDEQDLSKVSFDLEAATTYTKGYLEEAGDVLSAFEKELLPLGAVAIAAEQAVRFLTDYLLGDVYYKTDHPEHNLLRARAQLKLAQSVHENYYALEEKIRQML